MQPLETAGGPADDDEPTGPSENSSPGHDERPAPEQADGTSEEAEQTNDELDDMEHRAALAAMLYLLFISTLLVGAIVLSFAVAVRYGVVVFVAVCAAASAFAVVAATVTSVITRDAKLRRARSQIHGWHVTCKEEILREIANLKEDFAAYQSGDRLLMYYDDVGLDFVEDGAEDRFEQTAPNENESPCDEHAARTHKPKSMLFRYFATHLPKKPKLRMRRKKKSADASYQPPTLV